MSVEAPGRPDASGRGAAFSGLAAGDELKVVEPVGSPAFPLLTKLHLPARKRIGESGSSCA